ncbi:MAG TPA: thioredoxin-like domain-containing protein [Clostridia bacterium]|nr:thioredoxin-like domain-containing protein [Clostridia bacterium]
MAKGDFYAPEFPKNSIWLNSKKPLSLADLRGQVVLLDFWTYCCINCLHVLADLKYLEEKYSQRPFLVIGVHSAKFFNEKNIENIQSAIERYEIEHPVVVDEGHTIWESYAVSAWPSFVLIDAAGRVRGTLSGEGWRRQLDWTIEALFKEGEQEGILAKEPLAVVEKKPFAPNILSFPGKITLDPQGSRLFISDSNHNRVLICHFHSPFEAHILEIVGSGEKGSQNGIFEKASFNHPQGLVLLDDFLYVCDTENHLLRQVDLKEKTVKTIAGSGEKASLGVSSGPGLKTALNSPWDVGQTGGYLYLAMAGAHQIWSLRLADNWLEVFAGSGGENIVDGNLAAAQLAQPSGLSIVGKQIFFVDSEASALRVIDLQKDTLETLIGSGLFEFGYRNGPFKYALLQHPLGLFATEDEVYLADTYNHAIRRADLKTQTISTLIGRQKEAQVCLIGDRACEEVPLFEPNDVFLFEPFLFIADTNNHLIRVLDKENLSLRNVEIVTHPRR